MPEYKEILEEPSIGGFIRFKGIIIAIGGKKEVLDPFFKIYKTESNKWIVVKEILRNDPRFDHQYSVAHVQSADSETYREVHVCESKEDIQEKLYCRKRVMYKSAENTFDDACKSDPVLR